MILQADTKIQATARDRKRDEFAPPSCIACIHYEDFCDSCCGFSRFILKGD